MKKNVLVFPCGSEIGLEVYRALKFSKDFHLVGGSSVSDHGEFVYEDYVEDIPFIDDDCFIDKLNGIIKKYNIDMIIPAHDSVVLKLAQNSDMVMATIVSSNLYACEICRSKKKTYELFDGILPVPRVYKSIDEVDEYPVFLKPDVGQGAKGTKKVNNYEELKFYMEHSDDDLLILEYLPNEEYTIDCFTDFNGNLLYCEGRKRNRISNGISVSSIAVSNEQFLTFAKKINDKLHMNGAWFFQLKERANGEFGLLEIAPRIAGTMEFQRAFGVNLPLLSLYNALKIPVSICKNDYEVRMDRALSTTFKIMYQYDCVYIDLDDTLIVDGKVNYEIIAFLYKCINEGKKVVLVTRHSVNPLDTLEKYHIYNFFDQIIHLDNNSDKADFIQEKSVFIDDSHAERSKVFVKKIPVFDVNMVDVLK